MNIAIDITPLLTAHNKRGIGSYTRNLVEALQKYETKHSYSLFSRKQKVPDNADLVHYPYFDPFFLTLPLRKFKPTVVTVHDLIPLVFPDHFPLGIRGTVKWQIQKHSLGGCKRIVADSKCSKSDITKIAGIDKNIIDVIYLAPDPVFKPMVKKNDQLAKPYILYVGDVNWNKNVPGLLRAFSRMSGINLILVGNSFKDVTLSETLQLNSFIHKLGLEKSITRVGHVSDDELVKLYREAAILVQPSFYEGFGLPVLEAMACGCPVVTTSTSSLKEIAGPALQVSPNFEDILAGMTKMMSVDRKIQIKKQLEWVKQFTWKRVAAETVASYERAMT